MKHSKTCKIYLVRHGETEWNVSGKFQGHTDIPLNETGLAQALQLKQKLSDVSFSAVFSSDLLRAKKTAETLIHPLPLSIIEHKDLRERYMGTLEGTHVGEIDKIMKEVFNPLIHSPKEEYLSYKWHPEVETTTAIYNRVSSFLKQQIPVHLGSSILVVSHGGVIRSLLDHLDFRPGYRWVVGNCGFVELQATQNEFSVVHKEEISLKKFI